MSLDDSSVRCTIMRSAAQSWFESFARNFIRAYWQTVKSGTFSMPPNEPVQETVDELLAEVSHSTSVALL